jgi:DUF4097 and DUF4098 domain-containing protein YvlB
MRIEFRDDAVGRWLRTGALTAGLVLVALTALADDSTPINKSAEADPAGQVEVSNTVGTVIVTGWDRSVVEVTGELGEGTDRLEFERSGKLTRIKVVLPSKSRNTDDTDLQIKVPAGSGLFVNTVSADIIVQGVHGAQRLQAVSADIRTEAAAEDVECKTVSGDITVTGQGKSGLITITTVSGDARVQKVAGEVNGNTVSGNFSFELGSTSRSRLRSTSGDLGVTTRLTPDARLDIESISGDVRLDLLGKPAAEFDISSFNGEIRNCFGPKPDRTDEYTPGRELRFREGAASARVRVKTLNGDISLCSK